MIHNFPKNRKLDNITDYILRYKFDNNLLDEKGNYNLTGAGTQSFTTDRLGNALRAFNTVNNNFAYNDIAGQSLSGTNKMSFGGWFYVNSSLIGSSENCHCGIVAYNENLFLSISVLINE